MPRGTPVLAMVAAAVSAGCRRPPHAAPTPASTNDESYCWHAVFHTALPPDTVAAHFARAFTHVGLTHATWSRQADTAWAYGGPTVLGGPRGGATYAARVVAYRHGDTTRFRHYVSITPPTRGWSPSPDTASAGSLSSLIGLCGELGAAAAVHGTAPQWPNGEERLPVWATHRGPGTR